MARPEISGVRDFPHEKILLRWTSAIDAKWKKRDPEGG
jgi:hypothetical protein